MFDENALKPVDRSFFNQSTLQFAKRLLGCYLIHETTDGMTAGKIVETEAYLGSEDRAAHSFNNRRTKRTKIMFAEAGLAYIYTMHTHHLFNVVTGEKGNPQAVLVRGIEPVLGEELMLERRPVSDQKNLTSGPGKLSKALGINLSHYGHKLWEKPLYISSGESPEAINVGARIGIPNSQEAKDYPYRFWIPGNSYVSRYCACSMTLRMANEPFRASRSPDLTQKNSNKC